MAEADEFEAAFETTDLAMYNFRLKLDAAATSTNSAANHAAAVERWTLVSVLALAIALLFSSLASLPGLSSGH